MWLTGYHMSDTSRDFTSTDISPSQAESFCARSRKAGGNVSSASCTPIVFHSRDKKFATLYHDLNQSWKNETIQSPSLKTSSTKRPDCTNKFDLGSNVSKQKSSMSDRDCLVSNSSNSLHVVANKRALHFKAELKHIHMYLFSSLSRTSAQLQNVKKRTVAIATAFDAFHGEHIHRF